MRDHGLAEKGDYVRLDPSFIHIKRGRLNRPVQPSKDVPSTRLDQIPIAHISDRHTFACPAILVGGIFALDIRSEVQLRLIASLITRQYAISAHIDSALDALWIQDRKSTRLTSSH